MSEVIRIGTRDSELALWQANHVADRLKGLGHRTELVLVKSQGDLNLEQPLYEMGVTGIFTKTLDVALIQDHIDIAVHSMKDVPTQLPKGMVQAAVLERADHRDVLVHKNSYNPQQKSIIATGSLRRKAQWLHRYPDHEVVNLRGNVNTRLKKLVDNDWHAAIFAAAGLSRIDLRHQIEQEYGLSITPLDDVIPAPAQGIMMVAAMSKNSDLLNTLSALNHNQTEICAGMERSFLRRLEGGCTAPIGAYSRYVDGRLKFTGCLYALDGSKKLTRDCFINDAEPLDKVLLLADEILSEGGRELVASFR